jgi:alanyl-tRNA synthetase
VEFVCGQRAVKTARRDYRMLSESASLLSAHLGDVPQQVRKLQDEGRTSRKLREQLLEELADLHAARLLAETPETHGRKIVVRTYPDRDLTFIKLLAQRITRQGDHALALLGSTLEPPSIVFSQTTGQPFDMGALMKNTLNRLGGRGGGSKDMAQGGPQNAAMIPKALEELAASLNT